MAQIESELEYLSTLYDQRTALTLHKQEVIDTILTAEIKAKLSEIDEEFAPEQVRLDEIIKTYEERVKQLVLNNGASVKAEHLHAVYTKGRVSWDGKKLDGMMALVPGLAAARSEGAPSVSIRTTK